MEVLRILDEKKLEELVSNMDDRIRMHDYSKEQLLLLIEDYVTINFQGMKYQTREAILNMICDAVNYYDIGKDLNWESIIAIREDLEDDLKEYVDEIIYFYAPQLSLLISRSIFDRNSFFMVSLLRLLSFIISKSSSIGAF